MTGTPLPLDLTPGAVKSDKIRAAFAYTDPTFTDTEICQELIKFSRDKLREYIEQKVYLKDQEIARGLKTVDLDNIV